MGARPDADILNGIAVQAWQVWKEPSVEPFEELS